MALVMRSATSSHLVLSSIRAPSRDCSASMLCGGSRPMAGTSWSGASWGSMVLMTTPSPAVLRHRIDRLDPSRVEFPGHGLDQVGTGRRHPLVRLDRLIAVDRLAGGAGHL